MTHSHDHEAVLDFWFETLTPAQWFRRDDALDSTIATRFGTLLEAARSGELAHWRKSDRGRLAEIIVIDQFSRNVYRGDPRAFSHDPQALVLAQEAVRLGCDQRLSLTLRPFLYMPWMHSESLVVHQEAVRLFDQPGLERHLEVEHRHLAILERFGRYPHRNDALGRVSTNEERIFLTTPGSSF
ncbi:Uncharacterized conserved protein, DUF924 family [Kushneria avicenniae]|uniref:Uncharacterized conserved protein, DUF924 family n=1 Tax=Kushneria avicenniae TaxID=402385 RepID=A0A1I1JFS7_9GAMM|nr:DUF924 family protein [Kushneria avicenniae]SFC47011.1 Uncharacterized conserved protein, DUF924 family [Kushneria avicenniae]